MIEVLKKIKLWEKKKSFRKFQYKRELVTRKLYRMARDSTLSFFEDDDKEEHHSYLPSHGRRY